jgi:cytochrome c oxidase accessory protein FixG
MAKLRLPVLDGNGALRADGARVAIYPAEVTGRFALARKVVFTLLVALWVALPLVRIGGHPAVHLDIDHRQFFLLGLTFNAQDVALTFFLLTAIGFALVFTTALFGRAWCGWACPQTVFLDLFYRPLERLAKGNAEHRRRMEAGPWTAERIVREGFAQALFLLASLLVAHILLGYFVSVPALWRMVRERPGAHPEAFLWVSALTLVFYLDFAWFREQVCLIVCPYGRLQASLVDSDSITIGYDSARGEPRGKKGTAGAGDCVDCRRCVSVCPTGIDIRNGLQLDCIACTACIDACDEIMDKLERPRGLIRYDSLRGLRGEPRRFLRPRVFVYAAAGVVGALVASFAFAGRTDFEANLLRLPGPPYVLEGDTLRNGFEVHLVNKRSDAATFALAPEPHEGATFTLPMREVRLEPFESRRVPFFVTVPRASFTSDFPIALQISVANDPHPPRVAPGTFLGARR